MEYERTNHHNPKTFIIVKKYFQISHLDLVAVGDWVGLQVFLKILVMVIMVRLNK